jgi:hypothetical protein
MTNMHHNYPVMLFLSHICHSGNWKAYLSFWKDYVTNMPQVKHNRIILKRIWHLVSQIILNLGPLLQCSHTVSQGRYKGHFREEKKLIAVKTWYNIYIGMDPDPAKLLGSATLLKCTVYYRGTYRFSCLCRSNFCWLTRIPDTPPNNECLHQYLLIWNNQTLLKLTVSQHFRKRENGFLDKISQWTWTVLESRKVR